MGGFFRIFYWICLLKGVTLLFRVPFNNLILCFSVLHFSHHRFLGHRQDIGFSSVFLAIIAF
jgi:hypothetical protein